MQLSWLTQDFSIKAFSLLVALVLFLFVTVESATPVDVVFPISYVTEPDITVMGDAPNNLNVTLQGPWASFRRFDAEDLAPVVIDLSGRGPGQLRQRIETQNIRPPRGMSVVSVSRAEVDVTLDRLVERHVEVYADVIEKPPVGFEVVEVLIDPPRVWVSGPSRSMATLDFVHTRPINVAGKEDDIELEAELRPPPMPLRLKQKTVRVLIEVGEEFVDRVIEKVNVDVRGTDSKPTVTPKQVTLALRGPRNLLDGIDREALKVYVDVTDEAAEGQRRVEKSVEVEGLPERTGTVGTIPRVLVELKAKKRGR